MPLRVLFVEDSENDTALVLRELKRIGYEVETGRVETADAMRAALKDREWDVIICDYSLPSFDAPRALEVLQASGKDLPFIILSGTIGEETAVAVMKAGAHDFLLKGNLTRLGPVIEREMREAEIRRERGQAEVELVNREKRFRALIENGVDYISLLTTDGTLLWESPSATRMLGYEENEFVGRNILEIVHPDDLKWIQPRLAGLSSTPGGQDRASFRLRHHDGSWRWAEAVVTNLLNDPSIGAIVINYHDVTERKQAEKVLAETEVRLQAVLSGAPITIFVMDSQGVFTLSQGKGLERTGMKQSESVGKSALDLYGTIPFIEYSGETLTGKEVFQRALAGETVNAVDELRGVVFDNHISPIFDEEGKIVGVVGIAVDITERKRAEDAIRQHLAELEMLYQSGLALNQLLNPKEIAQKIIDVIGKKLDWHHVTVRLYHPENGTLELLASSLPDNLKEAEKRVTEDRFRSLVGKTGAGLTGWAVQHRQIVHANELSQDSRYLEIFPGLHSGLYVPLQAGDRMVGVISIESEKPHAFNEADERLMATLANQAAIALENAHLHEETLRQVQQLQALYAIDLTISSSFNQSFTLDVLLSHAINQLDADAASILLIQPHQQVLKSVAAKGFHGHGLEHTGLKLNNSFGGRAILERRMIHANVSELGTIEQAAAKAWSEEGFKSQHLMPLISKGEVKGVLGIFFRRDFAPTPAWNNFLETLAGQAAIAVDNTQMFNGLQRANMELAVAYDATIEGWSQAMDLRDHETEGHTQRVTKMAVELARAMKFDDEDIVHVRRGALLHDIGKIGVPDHILLKPDKLTDEEWQIMRLHPQFAYDMLSPISYLRRALDIPYCHHERWDGTGYPRRLKGEQIPLAARIFAAADVWDAVTSDRPYRKAWSKEDALQYIREQSGKHFDPQVVEVFLREFGNA